MFKKALSLILVVAVLLSSLSAVMISVFAATETATETKQTLNISVVTTDASNDLLKALQENYDGIKQYTSIQSAVEAVDTNGTDAIMVLAGAGLNYQYANTSTDYITADVYATLQEKGVRIYVEFPKNNDAIGITGYTQYGEADAVKNMSNEYRRAIVTSTGASYMDLAENTLLYAHGARYLKKTDTTNSWLVHAKVAGYDTLAYDDFTHTNSVQYSFLETNEAGDVLIAATKLSGFATGRWAPTDSWKKLWCGILSYLTDTDVTSFEYTPLMTATYTSDQTLSSDAYTDAVAANMQWYYNNMVPDVDGKESGWGGFYQRYRSDAWGWLADGNQAKDQTVRADCTGESIGAMAIASVLLDNDEYREIAYNAMDWMLNESNMANGDRHSDVTNSQYGLFGWYDDWNDADSEYAMDSQDRTPNLQEYYGDDNAKAILGLILGASALGTDEFDERILEAIMGNFRTTGTNGFRSSYFNGSSMDSDWTTYYNSETTEDLRAHFQALLWACYLWAYDKTGYEPLYERSEAAISVMMEAYENTMDGDASNSGEWIWTNSLQADRAKMAWTLSWLVRVSPTDEHIEWLNTMVNDMMACQGETGAIGEDLDSTKGSGDCDAPESNAEYGTKEAPVIHNADDPATDLLYVSGFAHTALNEAVTALAAAGQDTTTIESYRDKLASFHVRIQQSSTNSAYDGAWFRGFDYDKWEVYGSSSDLGWPVWDTETGWTNAQIASALALQQMDSSVWDYTEDSVIANSFDATATLMLEDEYTSPTATISSDVTLRWGTDLLVDGVYADEDATKWNSGKWTGAEGTDITLTLDYGQKKAFDYVTIGFDQYAYIGAFIPASITVYTSDDNITYTQVGKYETGVDIQAKYDAWYNNSNDSSQIYIDRIKTNLDQTVSARYVKIVVGNPMQSYSAAHNGITVTKTWIFMDEIELGVTSYSLDDLKTLIDSAQSANVSGKQVDSVLALEEALNTAIELYDSSSTSATKLKSAYTALESALQGLKDVNAVSIYSNSATDSWANSPQNLLNGNYKDVAMTYKVLADGAATEREVILDLGESTSVLAVGYAAQSRPASGIYLQNATFYVADSADSTSWTQVGYIGGAADSDGVYNTEEYQTLTAAANGSKGRYVKVVFSQCTDNVITNASEWLFLSEILINEFCPITVDAENATVTMVDSDGNTVGLLGAIYSKDVTVNMTAAKNAVFQSATLNGTSVTVENDSFVIENVTSSQSVTVSYRNFTDDELPTISGMKDLFVAKADALTFDPRIDITAVDKDGVDITSSVTYSSNIAATAGTYTVTYSVTAPNGAIGSATTNVHVVDSLNDKYVVAATPSASDVGSRNGINKAQILVDGQYAPSDATHSSTSFIPWKNTDNIEIIVALESNNTIMEVGYALASVPNVGALPPDVEFYATDELGIGKATDWTYLGKLEAELHTSDFSTYEFVRRTLSLDSAMTGGYIKAVICFDDSEEMLANYSSTPGKGVPEWTFVDEIIIGRDYELSDDVTISHANVTYETDGSISVNFHCPAIADATSEKLMIKNADGSLSKYGIIEANDQTFVDSYFAGTQLASGTKMYILKNMSAKDIYESYIVERVVDNQYISSSVEFSLYDYFSAVIDGTNVIYSADTTEAEKTADKTVAAAAINYGSTSATALGTDYDADALAKTKVLYWDGTTTAPEDTNGDGIYEIDSASDIAYLAQATNSNKTYGKTYKVNADIAAFVMQPESLGAIKDQTSVDAVKTFIQDNADNGLLTWKNTGYAPGYPFQGTFDGNGATVYGMYAEHSTGVYVGLFGVVDKDAVIKNLSVQNSYITSTGKMGVIAAASATNNNDSYNWNVTGNIGAGVVTIENCSVINNYISSGGTTVAGVVVGDFGSCDALAMNNVLVYGNDATQSDGTNIGAFPRVYNAISGNSICNTLVIGNPVYTEDQYSITYTNAYSTVEAAKAAYSGVNVTIIDEAEVCGNTAKTTLSAFDWDTVWYAGIGDGYPSLSKPVYKMPTDIQTLYDAYTVSGTDSYGVSNSEFGMYATSLNLKTNPYIGFTFAFYGEYKENRDNIKVIFTTASGKTVETTVGDGNGGVSDGWTNKAEAGRYHLYRLTDISVVELKGEISVKVIYNDTEYDFGTFSVAGFASAMQAAFEQDPCEYYSTRVEAIRALLFYIDAMDERYNLDSSDDDDTEDTDNGEENPDNNLGEDDMTGGRW